MLIFLLLIAIALLTLFFWQGAFLHGSSNGIHPEPGAQQIMNNISPQEAYALIQNQEENADFVILDVRTATEFRQAYIEKAVNVDFYSKHFQGQLQGLNPQKTYLVYCRSGRRSANTLQIMQKLGFREAYNMTEGILGWNQQNLPLVQ